MAVDTTAQQKVIVKEMSWDPITRIVGSLGIHTEIDFTNKQVLKAYSTSMVFRGFDIFMKGIDPRDAHFITSRICGICGDNHATCSCLNQNMAYGVKPPPLGDLAFNLAESADYMFDHAIFNDCMANVDFCEQMVKETNPTLLAKAESTSAPGQDIHGYKTIADIMRALNPFTGEFYLETLHVARYTREMYCLFGGRHTHPSTIMPGGCSADITHQTCTDYYVRLMRYFDYVKRSVPMHDDLYDFFLRELPGYDMVGYRETNLVNWGSFDDPDYVDYDYRTMTDWGRKRYITPGVAIGGELISTDLVEINLMIRILLGSSYFGGWEDQPTFVDKDPLGNPVDKNHPWNKVTLPRPQKRDFTDKYTWVVSPRMFDKRWAVRPSVVHGEGGPGRLRLPQGDGPLDPDGAAALAEPARDGARVARAGKVQRDRARPCAHLSPGVLCAGRTALPRASPEGGASGPDEELEQVQGARQRGQRRVP
jgi:hydrogenase large subunit